jgi:hypothetical protein
MKVFLDDERETPDGWERTRTVEKTLILLRTKEVTHLSLDNDLGEGLLEGYCVLDTLEEIVYNDPTFPIPDITVHSANASRVEYMQRAIQNIWKIRQDQEQVSVPIIGE